MSGVDVTCVTYWYTSMSRFTEPQSVGHNTTHSFTRDITH